MLQPPVRIGRAPQILVDTVVRWGPVSVLTARAARVAAIIVEDSPGLTPDAFRRTEPRC